MSPASSTRAPLVRSAVLNGYADLARALGLDPLRMLAAAGLPLASLVDPDLRIPVLQVGRLLTESAARTRRPDFGLLLAEKRSLANLGPLGLVAREQPTLRRAIDMLAPSIAMHNEALSLRIEDAGDVTILRVVRHDGDAAPMDQRNELALAALMRMLRRLTDDAFVAESVHFTHRAPADLATHRRLFGVTPVFSQDFDGIVIATRLLDSALPQADPLAAAQLARHLAVRADSHRSDIARATQELVMLLLPTGHASIARVAGR
ncbi:MAG TPA: AraC family transcriptional regulator, partial [Polymorphobacter sp.]|nr:AraC family transcriptional regulator [Polymorphobacter sp.]